MINIAWGDSVGALTDVAFYLTYRKGYQNSPA